MNRGENNSIHFWCYIVVCLLGLIICSIRTNAKEPEQKKIHATAYCISGTMANGEETREGTCASNLPFGTVVALYQNNNGELGDFIGWYEVADRGKTDGIKGGYVFDFFKNSKAEVQDFADIVYENESHGTAFAVIYMDAKG